MPELGEYLPYLCCLQCNDIDVAAEDATLVIGSVDIIVYLFSTPWLRTTPAVFHINLLYGI